MHCVPEDGAGREEAVGVVDFGVGVLGGEHGRDEFQFVHVLRDVCLDP